MLKMVTSQFAVETFCLTIPNKMLRGTLLCFTKSIVTKFSRIGEGRGERRSVTNFCGKFMSHSAKNLCRETLLCFTKSLVTKNFMERTSGKGGREKHGFLSKVFVSQF